MNDIVVYGATGFVGRLVAGHLAGGAARVALAGRSQAKLERVRDELGVDWPLIVADTDDPASLHAMAEQARVVATTVGPYRRGGLGLVDACIAAGAHYCDLTGEILFAHESLTRHAAAEEAGVRIVHSVGFDSIPSDLGTFLLHEHAGPLGPTTLAVTALKGGPSGGTLASMKGQVDEATADKAARRIVFDPYSLGGDGPPERDLRKVSRHKQLGWIGPFVMATYNTRIVRRSHSLLDYGPRVPLPRGLPLPEPGAGAGHDRRARRAGGRPGLPADAQGARQAASRPGRGPERARARDRPLQDADPRQRPRRHGRRQGRPRATPRPR